VTSVQERLRSRWTLFGVVGAAAVAVAVALTAASIVGSNDTKTAATTSVARTVAESPRDASTKPVPPTTVPGAAATIAVFNGIPQKLNVLGRAGAPVTMIEFADLQCPFCRDYAASALPALVAQYVRPGRAKFVFSGMHFIGPESEKALRAVYAAGLQGRLWEYLDLLYKSQGAENSGWVSDDLLRSVGASLPGFDTEKMLTDMSSQEVTNALAVGDQQAQDASVSSTPTFFAGKTGATLEHIDLTALTPDAFRPRLDTLIG
jgi:protein-disulfide isomerase